MHREVLKKVVLTYSIKKVVYYGEGSVLIIVWRKWKERLLFFLLFIILTCMLYNVMLWTQSWIDPTPKYKEPSGKAVKVFGDHMVADRGAFVDRLKFFYWYGE